MLLGINHVTEPLHVQYYWETYVIIGPTIMPMIAAAADTVDLIWKLTDSCL